MSAGYEPVRLTDHLQTCLQIFTFFPMLRNRAYISIVRKCFITVLILRFTYTAKIWEKKEKTKAKPKRSRSGMCFKL